MLGLESSAALASSSACSSLAARACNRAYSGSTARTVSRLFRLGSHVPRPEPCASRLQARLHHTYAGAACIALLRFLLTSEPRGRPSSAPWCALHARPPGWYMLRGPTLRNTRGVVTQGVVAGWIVCGGGHLPLELLLHGRVLVDEGRLRLGDLDLLARDRGRARDQLPLRLDSLSLGGQRR